MTTCPDCEFHQRYHKSPCPTCGGTGSTQPPQEAPQEWTICVCSHPECDGWAAAHFAEAVDMWHNHDGERFDFLPVTVREVQKDNEAEPTKLRERKALIVTIDNANNEIRELREAAEAVLDAFDPTGDMPPNTSLARLRAALHPEGKIDA